MLVVFRRRCWWPGGLVLGLKDVRRVCLPLPVVVEPTIWEQPAWFARTQVARIWDDGASPAPAADPDTA